jgi:hypothetical protein
MISFINNIFRNKKTLLVIFSIIVLVQLMLFLYFTKRADRITPPGHLHIVADEHSYYVGVILQSKLGAWAHTYSYTTLPSQKIYTYLLFIAAGKVAAIFNIDPVQMYTLVRITGAIAMLGSIYWLITLIIPVSLRIPAILLTMVFETGPMWDGTWTTSYFIPPLLGRHFYLAHHLWGAALGFSLLCWIIKSLKKPKRYDPVVIAFLSVTAPLANPTFSSIILVSVLGPWMVLSLGIHKLRRAVVPLGTAIAGIIIIGVFTLSQFSSGAPWNTVTTTEKNWWTTTQILIPFFLSYSLYVPFIVLLLILVPLSWKRWTGHMQLIFLLALSWCTVPVLLIWLASFPWVPFINGRIATDLTMVPYGILSTFVFYAAWRTDTFHRRILSLVRGLFLLVMCISLSISVLYFRQMLDNQDQAVKNKGNSWVEYPKQDLWKGIMALNKVPAWSHILVNPRVADVLPVYLPLRVYQGSTSEGTDWAVRRSLSYEFYTGMMPEDRLTTFLKNNAIDYVFYGPEEKYATRTTDFYPDILETIYTNPEVTIFKVKPFNHPPMDTP